MIFVMSTSNAGNNSSEIATHRRQVCRSDTTHLKTHPQTGVGRLKPAPPSHHTRQALARTIGWLDLQAKALANSGMLETTPLMRYSSGECGSVSACRRLLAGRSSPQAHCAMPMK